MKISEKIQLLRKKKGLSQENLANMLNLSRQAVFKWEAGESTPDIENIKKLAEIFEVSFDILLNDKIDDLEFKPVGSVDAKDEKKPIKYRRAFASNESMLSSDYGDVDNGFIRGRKIKYDNKPYYDKEYQITNEGQRKYGFQKYMTICSNSLISFFDDSSKKVFGFMCNESIQLYVPYENLIDCQILDNGKKQRIKRVHTPGIAVGSIFGVGLESNPIVVDEDATIYTITITFFDENGEIKNKRFGFSTFLLSDTLLSPLKEIEFNEKMRRTQIIASLNNLKSLLLGIKEIGMQIRDGRVSVADEMIDFDFDKQINEWKERRIQLTNQIKEDMRLDNRRKRNKTLITAGIIFGVIFIWILWVAINK